MDTKSSVYSFFLLAVLGFSLFLAWLVLRPFLHTLILVMIFTTPVAAASSTTTPLRV